MCSKYLLGFARNSNEKSVNSGGAREVMLKGCSSANVRLYVNGKRMVALLSVTCRPSTKLW